MCSFLLLFLFFLLVAYILKQPQEVFRKKGVLRNFTQFTGKHLCQNLFFLFFLSLRPATLLKKRLTQVFSCEFCEISKNTSLHRTPLVAAFVVLKHAALYIGFCSVY